MNAGEVRLSFQGIPLVLESRSQTFLQYVDVAMQPFVDSGQVSPRIRSTLEWFEGAPTRDPGRAFGLRSWDRRPDRDLYVAGETVYWLRIDDFEDLQIAATWRDDCLHLRGRYHFRLGPGVGAGEAWRRLRHWRRLDRLRMRRFSTLLYYLVYHPVLWILSRERGWQVLHAGAVASERGAGVFAGMPGCGKSTLAVAMTADPAWTLLSDNLVLHDGSRVLACPELLLLDPSSIARVGCAAQRLQATGERRVYGRDAYRPARIELNPRTPLAIFVVERGRTSERVRLDVESCAAMLAAGNRTAKEVRRIQIMAEVLDLAAERVAPDEIAATRKLVAAAPAYGLRVQEGADLQDLIAKWVAPVLSDSRTAHHEACV